MNEIRRFLTNPVGAAFIGVMLGVIAMYVGSLILNVQQRRKAAARSAAEQLRNIRETRLRTPSSEPAAMAHVLAVLRAYAFIIRLDVLVNRRLVWAFTILIIETISFTANGAPTSAFAWATYFASTGFAVAFMLSAFAMTRRATAEYRALITTGSLQEDEVTRLPDFMLP